MMVTDKDIYDYLEHVGVKGMRWGVRKQRINEKLTDKQKKNLKRAAVVTGIGTAALAGAILGRVGQVSVKDANAFANDKASKVLIDIGHRYARSRRKSTMLFNEARQVNEGLIWDFYKL